MGRFKRDSSLALQSADVQPLCQIFVWWIWGTAIQKYLLGTRTAAPPPNPPPPPLVEL